LGCAERRGWDDESGIPDENAIFQPKLPNCPQMKIHTDIEQGSLEWSVMRAGRVTASGIDNLITPLGKPKEGDAVKTYMLELLAENWIGGPLPAVQGVWDLDQGNYLERYARPAFTLETGFETSQVSFIEGDDTRTGASPDGLLVGKEIGLELKCPHVEKHIRYLIDGCVPKQYMPQVQFSMYVTGYSQWYFASYRMKFPMLVMLVERDDKWQKSIGEALHDFFEAYDGAWKRLVAINGAPPPPRQQFRRYDKLDDPRFDPKPENFDMPIP